MQKLRMYTSSHLTHSPMPCFSLPALPTRQTLLTLSLVTLGLWQSPSAQAQALARLPSSVTQALHAANIPLNATSWWVAKVGEASPRLAWRADVAMNPASTIKLVTTQVALQLLGPEYRWRTEIFTDGTLQGQTLVGNLYVRGQGDPKLVPEELEKILRQLRAQGIQTIQGNLILDKSYFSPQTSEARTIDGETQRAYNVSPDALLYAFKTLSFTFNGNRPSGERVQLQVTPPLAQLRLENTVQLSDGPCEDWRANLRGDVAPQSDGSVLARFSGQYPRSCEEQVWSFATLDHNRFFWGGFVALWENLGGSFNQTLGLQLGKVPSHARLLVAHEGIPLLESLRDINKFSNNVMARQVFLTLGAKQTQLPASVTLSSQVISAWLAQQQLPMPELTLENGSGLSRIEKISARHMGELLALALRKPHAKLFMATLPIAGLDGTMKKRLAGQLNRSSAYIKTGTLNEVKTIAGYVVRENGDQYITVAFVNHPKAQAAQAAYDAFLRWVAGEEESNAAATAAR